MPKPVAKMLLMQVPRHRQGVGTLSALRWMPTLHVGASWSLRPLASAPCARLETTGYADDGCSPVKAQHPPYRFSFRPSAAFLLSTHSLLALAQASFDSLFCRSKRVRQRSLIYALCLALPHSFPAEKRPAFASPSNPSSPAPLPDHRLLAIVSPSILNCPSRHAQLSIIIQHTGYKCAFRPLSWRWPPSRATCSVPASNTVMRTPTIRDEPK